MDEPLLASLFNEAVGPRAMSVSELNADIKTALEREFSYVWVEGEIVNFVEAASGHWYFSLTDGDSFLKAACFKGQNYRIRFMPSDGLQVRCLGRITTYEKRGEYQLMVESLEPVGEGALIVAFEQIKARLAREGLFDEERKRPIPMFPRRVGIVTSPTGAAVHDILTVLDRRARSVDIVIIPTQVQGERASEQIAGAIRLANEYCEGCPLDARIDVLIVGRGGGSTEDLWAFNEERVARAICASKIPVISAVGHEIDFTIADMAADLRAPTPSAAAEIVAQSEEEVMRRIGQLTGDLTREIEYLMLAAHADLQSLEMAPVFAEFPAKVRERRYELDDRFADAEAAIHARIDRYNESLRSTTGRLSPAHLSARAARISKRLSLLEYRSRCAADELTAKRQADLEMSMARLDALSPLGVLTRGYSITQKASGEIVREAHQTDVGERVDIRLARGRIEAEVTKVTNVME
ncbi:MAG: exodeoxyribonuclease VII large subunit [Pyrinomonadaceae bacterium]